MTYKDENAAERAAFIAWLELEYSAVFVPQSVSRNRDDKTPSLNWRVTISGNHSRIDTDYMQGIGHVPAYPMLPRTVDSREVQRELEKSAETGKYPKHFAASTGTPFRFVPLPSPDLEQVLYSLVSDAEASDQTFEEWASNYGYDTDSRKAEATYRACVDIGIRLRRVLGGPDHLAKLSNLFSGF